MLWGSNLFHIGILAILGGHFVGLLTPVAVFDAFGISHTFKQLLAMMFGGIAGIACWVGIAMLTHRRLFDARIRKTSSFGDIAILLLLWVQLTLGLLTIPISAQHLDGSEMVKFMNWAQGILTLHPGAAVLVAHVNPIFKLHLFPGHDGLPGLPVHEAGPRLERAGLVSWPSRLIGRAYQAPGRGSKHDRDTCRYLSTTSGRCP
jgi:nitrate reductase gamma subunit